MNLTEIRISIRSDRMDDVKEIIDSAKDMILDSSKQDGRDRKIMRASAIAQVTVIKNYMKGDDDVRR